MRLNRSCLIRIFVFHCFSIISVFVQSAHAESEDPVKDFLDLKFGLFIHYNLATYDNNQWVAGYKSPALFDPGVETIDTDAWADAAVAAGMKYAVLTVKHVSGFCLWDSQYTTYDVMHPECPYQKDLVAQFVESFSSRGLGVGFYYCWRNPGFDDRKPGKYKVLPPECDPATHSLAEQNKFQKQQIIELTKLYPDVFYIWNDGLDPRVMSAEDAATFFESIDPQLVYSCNWWDWGKKGDLFAGIAVTETKHFLDTNALPGETCWKLEPQGWFIGQGAKPKTAKDIFEQLTTANARGANFLLNVAPNKKGEFEPESVEVLRQIGALLSR